MPSANSASRSVACCLLQLFSLNSSLLQEIRDLEQQILRETLRPERCLQFMRAGRLLRIHGNDTDWGWGVLVNHVRTTHLTSGQRAKPSGAVPPAKENVDAPSDTYVLNCLLLCGPTSTQSKLLSISPHRLGFRVFFTRILSRSASSRLLKILQCLSKGLLLCTFTTNLGEQCIAMKSQLVLQRACRCQSGTVKRGKCMWCPSLLPLSGPFQR